MQSCRECKFFDIEAVKNRSGAVMSNKSARCGWKLTVPVPDSVPIYNREIKTTFVRSNEGSTCQAFIRRGIAQEGRT